MKIAAIVLLAGLALGGCTQQEMVLVQKWHIPTVPSQLYNCPILTTYPAVKTLRDSQVAKLLITLRSNNLTCKQSLEGIRRFLADARNTVR